MKGNVRQSALIVRGPAVKGAGFSFVVLALLFVVLMAGCAHKQAPPPPVNMATLVHQEISDPVRADKVVALMEELSAGLLAVKEINAAAQQDFMKLNADYSTTPVDLMNHMEGSQEARYLNRKKILDAYFGIKALTTRQEWEAISQTDRQALDDFFKKTEVSSQELQ